MKVSLMQTPQKVWRFSCVPLLVQKGIFEHLKGIRYVYYNFIHRFSGSCIAKITRGHDCAMRISSSAARAHCLQPHCAHLGAHSVQYLAFFPPPVTSSSIARQAFRDPGKLVSIFARPTAALSDVSSCPRAVHHSAHAVLLQCAKKVDFWRQTSRKLSIAGPVFPTAPQSST